MADFDTGQYYSDAIYKQRYDKWVYEGSEITMIFVDTHVDGMKYFMLFDNKKRKINEHI